MMIELLVSFHDSAREVQSFLPERFAFLRPLLRDWESGSGRSYCVCRLPMGAEDEIIAWARQHRGGRSISNGVRITEQYGLEDLDALEVVEVFEAPGEDIADTDSGEVLNYQTALDVTFDCAWCDRVKVRQVADLEVVMVPGRDVLETHNLEWVLSKRAREALRSFDLSYRPLADTGDHQQLLVRQTATLRLDVPSLSVGAEPCPGCGRYRVGPRELIEGDPRDPERRDLCVWRRPPLTIMSADPAGLVWARSDVKFNNTFPHDRPVHRIGERVPTDEVYSLIFFTGDRPYFARAELVRRLLESGNVGLSFRPVNVVPT